MYMNRVYTVATHVYEHRVTGLYETRSLTFKILLSLKNKWDRYLESLCMSGESKLWW